MLASVLLLEPPAKYARTDKVVGRRRNISTALADIIYAVQGLVVLALGPYPEAI